jgi:hypothetical protein
MKEPGNDSHLDQRDRTIWTHRVSRQISAGKERGESQKEG